ncbi:LysR family transcriptional regulator [Williamsia deligens]|uniref:LysR family transcriptional regulator n=1 Tax=Williamsia deligens TaxID=321325 RepID=A0ABW3G5B6_9NOCA|nr:LysR family transcriptional regulator [Williamsia deligens]MCP2193573.1 DNA-binding transcriptional regulator, LysR family [Williamsia deligens]
MATLDIPRLRSLVTVASVSGVRPAAEALHLSPAAVSGHIRKLETELGCRLLMAQGRGIGLTSDGEELVERARTLLDVHDAAVRALAPPGDGELLVAATEHAAEFLVPVVVATLDGLHPEVDVRVRLTRSERVRQLADDDRADVALMLTRPARGSVHIADIPLHWLSADGSSSEALVLFANPCAVRHRALASIAGRAHHVARECADLSTVLATARGGAGMTPLPRIGPLPDGLRRVRDLPAIPHVPLYAMFGDRVQAATRAAVVAALRSRLGEPAARRAS